MAISICPPIVALPLRVANGVLASVGNVALALPAVFLLLHGIHTLAGSSRLPSRYYPK
jgi:hypothetical protein